MDGKQVISSFNFSKRIIKLSNLSLYFYRLRKLMSILLCLCGLGHLVFWDICCLLFWVFAFVVPCLNTASTESPSLSKVTSPFSQLPPPHKSLLLVLYHSQHLPASETIFCLCLHIVCFSHLTIIAPQEQWCYLFCLDYLWMFRLAQSTRSFSSCWMNQRINFLKTTEKLFMLDTIWDLYYSNIFDFLWVS